MGSADDIYKRWANHKTYLNKGTHSNNHLQNSWNLYGAENFEFSILETCSHDEKYKLEQKYIDKTKCYDSNFGYNIQRYVVAKDNSKGERSMQAKYTDN